MSVVTVRSPLERFSTRISLRSVWWCAGLGVAIVLVALVSLATGDFEVSFREVLGALFGGDDGGARLIVVEWRLPRVLAAIVFGAALAVSGGIFQTITRNPLGSPDVMGFSAGAYTGAVLVIISAGGTFFAIAIGSLVGGLATAAVVYLLAYRRGIQGFRLIVVGIAVGAMLEAVNSWLILRAKLEVARTAAIWGAGSLGGIRWEQAAPAIVLIVLTFPAVAILRSKLRALELGDDMAQALGVRANPARLALVVVAIALIAVVTAATGPIAFLALAAPQIARRLVGAHGIALVPAAFVGALLLALSDLAGQRLFAPHSLPVGIVTVVVGGVYLVALIIHEVRKSS